MVDAAAGSVTRFYADLRAISGSESVAKVKNAN